MAGVSDNQRIPNSRGLIGIRRRVYCFGFISMLLALGQIALYTFMLSLAISADYSDLQVALGSGWMIILTSTYLALTARVLFLLYERRYEEAKGPEWLWWYSSMAVVLFNILLVIWFWLMADFIPVVACGIASTFYIIFFVFASRDIKHISDNDDQPRTNPTKTTLDGNRYCTVEQPNVNIQQL